jgi:hypothetical protein
MIRTPTVADAARWAVERLQMKLVIFGMGYTAQALLDAMARPTGPAMWSRPRGSAEKARALAQIKV